MKFYFDSSALTKRYVSENGSSQVDSLFLEAESVIVSIICLPEIVSALTRISRENKINAHQYELCKRAVIGDFASFVVCPLSSEVLRTTIHVLEKCQLRAADAIHLACAINVKASRFISSDQRQILAAKELNLTVEPIL